VIFCSIDDRNQAYIKGLFDEVFEERNFIANVVVNRASEIATDKTIQKHEYCILYSKDSNYTTLCGDKRFTISRGTVGNADQTMPIITFPKGLKCLNIKDGTYTQSRQIVDSRENIEIITPFIVKNGQLEEDVQLKARWRSSNDMRKFFDNQCQPTKAKINGIITEIYFDGDRMMPYIKKNITEKISSLYLNNSRGSKYVEDLGIAFDFPKSVDFIKEIVNLFVGENGIVLDFFFGSGTTGQAVLELNKNSNSIQFIGVQLNEDLDKALETVANKATLKTQIALCDKFHRPHNLAEITCERLRRVMTGKDFAGNSDFKWAKENKALGGNLDVYEIAEVANFESIEGKTPFDVIDETLYGKEEFGTLKEKVEWVCENFELTQKRLEE
jgi:adenine-specific DNA-methyltransferase